MSEKRRWSDPSPASRVCIGDRARTFADRPSARPDNLAQKLVAIGRDGRIADRETMLRQQVRDGSVEHPNLPQLDNDFLRRRQVLEVLWTTRCECGDRLSNAGWIK